MTWFKVDDGLPDHRKVRHLGRDRMPAIGLWALCGAWSAGALSDGFVPDEVVDRYDPKHRHALRLVDVGLWIRVDDEDDPGYLFRDWETWQPTRDEVEKRRADIRDRVRRHRERRHRNTDGNADGNAFHHGDRTPESGHETVSPPQNGGHETVTFAKKYARTGPAEPPGDNTPPGIPAGHSAGNGNRNALPNALVTPPPSRPVPTRPERPSSGPVERGGSPKQRAGIQTPPQDHPEDQRPADRCPRALAGQHDDTQPCGPCKRARETAENWDTARTAARDELAHRRRQTRTNCTRCDDHGWQTDTTGAPTEPATRCTHQPDNQQEAHT